MATGGQTENTCSLINVEGVTLENTNDSPWYYGIVVFSNKIFVINWYDYKVWIHGLQDGRLLYESDILYPKPRAACLINDSEIAVILYNGLIKIMSTHITPDIRWTRDLRVRGILDRYDGVVSFSGDLVVCGVKENTVCWCIVSSNDGHVVGTIHRICKVKSWSSSFITAKHNIIYISCDVGSPDTGVYAYDAQNPSKYKYSYKHKDLKRPRGIAMDQHGSLFVCNMYDPYYCIHHLTSECQLVSIITQGIPSYPWAIFCDDGLLYVTNYGSQHITRYRTQYPDSIIPSEVLNMDPRSIEMYRKALRNGKEKVFNIRIMVVGPYDVGKTTLTKRLLGKDVNICDRQSTEGIDVQTECSKVSLATGEWITQEQNAEQNLSLQRLVKLFSEQVQQKSNDKKQVPKEMETHDNTAKQDKGHAQHDLLVRAKQDIDEEVLPTLSQPVESSIANLSPEASSDVAKENEKDDALMKIIQLVNANSDKLEKSMEEYAKLGMWDFAGQYVFYTTHQTFLSYRAVYLLVIDLSQQITALIKDDCFIDTEGLKLCQVQETINTWMNLIHSCTPSSQSGIPAVILVGTHVDKIPERYRHEVCEKYFREIRSYLKNKPTRLHLVDEDFAIDNTVVDSRLVALKQKIVEVASQQPYWGEEVPARWILLEKELMRLKAAGIKVIPRTLLEAFNQAEDVQIPTEELDLFLKFHNDIGTILYFSIEELKDKIVLVPQWMIDAVKSLITAEMFVLRNALAVSEKWDMFNKSGKLFPELIDAIWTKEKNPDLHDNKEHILLLMEHLNIIARPRCFSEDRSEIKVENYFLAPCMLKETTPDEVMFPKSDPEMKSSSSVLCYNFMDKFLPSSIFHRLLATCVSQWPIAQRKSENQIFCGCCIFSLDLHHRLTVLFREYIIFVQVIRFGTTEMTPSSKLCTEAQEFITKNLTSIISYLGQSLKFEMSIQCPKSVGYRVDCLIPLADLQRNVDVPCHFQDESHVIRSQDVLKFWFQKEEPSDEGWSLENLGVQDEPEVSQKGNLKASIDQTEAVFIHKKLAELAKSIGIIKTPCGSGTGFRVGPNYVMTARHVVELIMRKEKLHQTVLNLRKDLSVGDVMQQERFDDGTIHDISVDKGQSDVKTAVPPSGQRPEDSENGKQDQNPEKDISFIECIKESNFRKIGLLLKNLMVLPSKNIIIHAIKEHGYNKGIQCLLRGMANLLRKQIPDAIRVWSGYRAEDLHTPIFVVMFSKKTIIPEKMIFSEPYDDYEIVFRNEHTPNEEEVRISEQSEANANTINMEDIARVLDCIAKNTERLMNEHSNLSIIAASTVKAMGFIGCLSERKLIESMCIVLYVPLKGIIPMGEKEFPKDIDGISTDVREGEFVFHGRKEAHKFHPKLPMGCRISTRAGQSGTLGGFVDLPGGKTGCITAAHVVLNKTERKNYVKFKKVKKAKYNASLAQGQNIIEIYQPTCKRAAFGKVSQITFEEGNKSAPSVDAAVIEITDHNRTPYTGMFPSGNCPVIGLTKENPMMYNSGKTRDHSNISIGSTVVKYGFSTNITHGKLEWNGASVRIVTTEGKSWNRLKADNISYPKFFNQMVVKSSDEMNFSAPGDSGALVFVYHASSRDLEAIGLLIGGSTHRSSVRMHIVTPIQAVFQQLGLENVMFKRFPDINWGEQNLAMNEPMYSRHVPEIHHEISNTRINELKEEIKEALKEEIKEVLKEEMKETTKLEINAIKEEMKETTKLEINAIKEEIKEIRETVMEQMKANTSSLEQTIIRLLSKPGGDAGKG